MEENEYLNWVDLLYFKLKLKWNLNRTHWTLSRSTAQLRDVNFIYSNRIGGFSYRKNYFILLKLFNIHWKTIFLLRSGCGVIKWNYVENSIYKMMGKQNLSMKTIWMFKNWKIIYIELEKRNDRDRTRTCNLRIRSPTPYPLGHTVMLRVKYLKYQYQKIVMNQETN